MIVVRSGRTNSRTVDPIDRETIEKKEEEKKKAGRAAIRESCRRKPSEKTAQKSNGNKIKPEFPGGNRKKSKGAKTVSGESDNRSNWAIQAGNWPVGRLLFYNGVQKEGTNR